MPLFCTTVGIDSPNTHILPWFDFHGQICHYAKCPSNGPLPSPASDPAFLRACQLSLMVHLPLAMHQPSSNDMVVSFNQSATGVFAFLNATGVIMRSESMVTGPIGQHARPHPTAQLQHNLPQGDWQSALSLFTTGFASTIERFL